jgi:hypothetical protein
MNASSAWRRSASRGTTQQTRSTSGCLLPGGYCAEEPGRSDDRQGDAQGSSKVDRGLLLDQLRQLPILPIEPSSRAQVQALAEKLAQAE